MDTTYFKSGVGIAKIIATVLAIVTVGLAASTRPNDVYKAAAEALDWNFAREDLFLAASIIVLILLPASLIAMVLLDKNDTLRIADALVCLALAILLLVGSALVLYSVVSRGIELWRDYCGAIEGYLPSARAYEDYVPSKCVGSTGGGVIPGLPRFDCTCLVKHNLKYEKTIAGGAFGFINSIVLVVVSVLGFKARK